MNDASPGKSAIKCGELWRQLVELTATDRVDEAKCLTLLDEIVKGGEVAATTQHLVMDGARTGTVMIRMVLDAKTPPMIRIERLRAIAKCEWIPQEQRLTAADEGSRAAFYSGRPNEAMELTLLQLELMGADANREMYVQAKIRVANTYFYLGQKSVALEQFDVLLNELRPHERVAIAKAHGDRAQIFQNCGRHDEALEALGKAEQINRDLGRSEALGGNMHTRGNILLRIGEVDAAQQLFQELEEFALVIGERRLLATAMCSRALALRRLGRYDEALGRYQAADRIWTELDHKRNRITGRGNIATLFYHMGKVLDAEHEFARAADDALAAGMQEAAVANLCGLAELLLAKGDPAHARATMDRVHKLARADDAVPIRLDTASLFARLLVAEGNFDQAIAEASNAVVIAKHSEQPEQLANLRAILAEALLMSGQGEDALTEVQLAHDIAFRRMPPYIEGLVRSSLVWAKCAEAANDMQMVSALALDLTGFCNRLKGGSIDSVRLAREAREFAARHTQ
jgi:tetratricopeptide (TPR) repeat protein